MGFKEKKVLDLSTVKNKATRLKLYEQQKIEKAKAKREKRKQLSQIEKDDPEAKKVSTIRVNFISITRLEENVPNTQENTREHDETIVEENDEEVNSPASFHVYHQFSFIPVLLNSFYMLVQEDEAQDEYSEYYTGKIPKVIITTTKKATKATYEFSMELKSIIPDSQFIKRQSTFSLDQIMEFCSNRDYTDLIVVSEDHREPTHITIIHLPEGPSAKYRLTRIKEKKYIVGHGNPTAHKPEIILNNFNTRLGHIVGKMFAALFPQIPEFEGRQAVTFHNQRDFIFFRRHRYEFVNGKKVNLQEIGPRFTLRLCWIMKGLYDLKNGEYIWMHKVCLPPLPSPPFYLVINTLNYFH
ncbi:Ribosome production factor 1 [Smittium mucronatum]|uniref:Ribosome production factor 1 n=1 Tax=Smittium mucronatum TaxID=133383 RepID=A0A1R0H0Q5_9FUNG|nr:Ribosome production factor 1 [Smittium mucronatum]